MGLLPPSPSSRHLLPGLLALSAAVALVGFHAWAELRVAESRLRSALPTRAEAAAREVDALVSGVLVTLDRLAEGPGAGCDEDLRERLLLLPDLADLHRVGAQGATECTLRGLAPDGIVQVAGRRVGTPLAVARPGVSGGAEWVVPVEAEGGGLRGLLRVEELVRRTAAMTLAPGEVVLVADTLGVVVSHSGDPTRWIGRTVRDLGPGMPGAFRVPSGDDVRTRHRILEERGADGVVRAWAGVPLEGTPWAVLVGAPREAIVAPIRASALRNAGFAFLVLLLLAAALGPARPRPAPADEDPDPGAERRALDDVALRIRLVLGASGALLWDWDLATGRLHRNEGLRTLMGITEHEEGWGRASLGFIPEPDRSRVRAGIDRVLEGAHAEWSDEFPVETPDGRLLRVRERGHIIRGRDGVALRVVGTTTDLTEERRRSAEARGLEERYASIVRSAPFGIFLARADGRLLEWNEALERVLGRNWTPSDPPVLGRDFAPETHLHALVQEMRTEGGISELQVHHSHPDGSERVLRLSLTFSRAGGEELLEGLLQDVTDRHRFADRMRHAQKMEAVGRLAGGVAHDFNNLLTVISGEARILLANPTLDPDQRESIEAVLEAGTRGARLTRQLLRVSRRQPVRPVALSVNEVVGRVQGILIRLLGERIVLTTRLDPDLALARADEGELEQVILNLVLNARDALPDEGGRIEVRTGMRRLGITDVLERPGLSPGRYVVLSVEDDGTGIEPEIVSRIFEPFFTTKVAGKGTGLGLSMVYGMVTRVGGSVEVVSRPGEGTTVRVYLREADAGDRASPPAPVAAGPDEGGAPGRIVIVEDEDAVRRMAFRVLERAGHEIQVFARPAEAEAYLSRADAPVDLLVTDVRMPELSGHDLADRVRRVHPELPILFVSGYPEEADLKARLGDPRSAFLPKPFTPDALLGAVRRLLHVGAREG
jgi:two-component system, cell cycle sensor histidine kinase and response regulator CckA